MAYKDKIEEDKLKQIMEQNIWYLNQIAEQMKLGYVSVFAGAGLSVASGYVDWKRLLEPICRQMRLNHNLDLTEIAQYYKNKYGRQGLNDVIFNEFAKVPKNNENAAWLAKLPIKEYWTTNYDDVIEREIEKYGKNVETIISQESFKYHDPKREVVVYKMHGDKKYPDDVVLTKEDYQRYDEKRKLFTRLLSVELVRRTFLFIGFSFNDPNLERILSIAKNSLNSKSLPKHYCFMRKVQMIDYLDNHNKMTAEGMETYIQDKNYQELRISDMTHYGIYTILVEDYNQITLMLQYLYNKYITNNVFISGGINPKELSEYGNFNNGKPETSGLNRAESFLELLGKKLIDHDFQIYTGFGAGVGNYILSGVLKSKKNQQFYSDIMNSKIHISSLIGVADSLKEKTRKKLIEQCSSTLILFGYSPDKEKSGIYQEYEIARELGNYIIPVKATGFAARDIYNELDSQGKLQERLRFLKNEDRGIEELADGIIGALTDYKEEKEKQLSQQLFSSVAMYGAGVFISYYYKRDHAVAEQITKTVNEDKLNIFTVVQEMEKKRDSADIKNWVDEEIKKTRITILLISRETLDREYVSYELTKSILNGNVILPVLMDNPENGFQEEEIERIKQKLCLQLSVKNLDMKQWVQDQGSKNIVRWLNKIFEV